MIVKLTFLCKLQSILETKASPRRQCSTGRIMYPASNDSKRYITYSPAPLSCSHSCPYNNMARPDWVCMCIYLSLVMRTRTLHQLTCCGRR